MALLQSTEHFCAIVLLLFACLVCCHKENIGGEGGDALTGTAGDQIEKPSARSNTTVVPASNLASNENKSADSAISEQNLDIESSLNSRPLLPDLGNSTLQMRTQMGEVEREIAQNFTSPNRMLELYNGSSSSSGAGLVSGVTDVETGLHRARVAGKGSEESSAAEPQLQSEVTRANGGAMLNASYSRLVPNMDSEKASELATANSEVDTSKQANIMDPMLGHSSRGDEFNMSKPSIPDVRHAEKQQQLKPVESHKNLTVETDDGRLPLIKNQTHTRGNSTELNMPTELYTNALNNTNEKGKNHYTKSTVSAMQIKPTESLPAVANSEPGTERTSRATTSSVSPTSSSSSGELSSDVPQSESGIPGEKLTSSPKTVTRSPAASYPDRAIADYSPENTTPEVQRNNHRSTEHSLFDIFKPHRETSHANPSNPPPNLFSYIGRSSTNSPDKGHGSYLRKAYPPHAIHGLIWEEKQYLLSVLVPIGCGVAGALLIVCVAYAIRSCPGEKRRPIQVPALLQEVTSPRIDQIMLLADSSDDDSD